MAKDKKINWMFMTLWFSSLVKGMEIGLTHTHQKKKKVKRRKKQVWSLLHGQLEAELLMTYLQSVGLAIRTVSRDTAQFPGWRISPPALQDRATFHSKSGLLHFAWPPWSKGKKKKEIYSPFYTMFIQAGPTRNSTSLQPNLWARTVTQLSSWEPIQQKTGKENELLKQTNSNSMTKSPSQSQRGSGLCVHLGEIRHWEI